MSPGTEPPSLWARWKGSTAYPYLWLGVYGLWLLFAGVAAFRLLAPLGALWLRGAGYCVVALLPPVLLWLSDRTSRWYEPGRQ